MSEIIEKLLAGNKAWVEQTNKTCQDFFEKLAQGQSPRCLWIGCADSRVPETIITGSQPGDLFVQRNIANMVIPEDRNLFSVVYYAVAVLKIEHIIVCGHYGCGGVKAAMSNDSFGPLDRWLAHIRSVRDSHQKILSEIPEESKRMDRLVELNVLAQARNLADIPCIQARWRGSESLHIHGWVYDLSSGFIKTLDIHSSADT